jgi:hypothetical protein
MKKIFFAAIIFSLICSPVFAGQKAKPAPGANTGADASAIARDTVNALFDAYKNYHPSAFDKLVSPEILQRQEFINNIEKGVLAGPVIELNNFIDSAVQQGNALAVKVKWEKKTQPRTDNKPKSSKGNAELAFQKLKDKWLLQKISGDNPFF